MNTTDRTAEDRAAVIHAHRALRAHRDAMVTTRMRGQSPPDPTAAVMRAVDRWSAAVISCEVVHQARLELASGEGALVEAAMSLHRAETAWVTTLACEAMVAATDDDGEVALSQLKRTLAVARARDSVWLEDLTRARLLALGLVFSQIGEADRAAVQARRTAAAGRWHLLAETR